MSHHIENKRLFADFLAAVSEGREREALDRYCVPECRFEIFHPFNSLEGKDAALEHFFEPLREAIPDYEYRTAFVVAGAYEENDMVSAWGHVMGTFEQSWISIPPTNMLTYLCMGVNAIVRDGKIAKVYILLDIVEVMRQAGHYPLREMPGTAGPWPFPPCDTGASAFAYDPERGAETFRIVMEMQSTLVKAADIPALKGAPAPASPHWHDRMNWYGPAGIGSMRQVKGFKNFHGQLFLQAFPDRGGWVRDPNGPQDAPGHYIRVADGLYMVTAGYPSLRATHTGPEWLGLPPTGRKIELRVADWYRLDDNGKIYDNWVMMDIPHILLQMGIDIFHDMQFFNDRSKQRLRLPH